MTISTIKNIIPLKKRRKLNSFFAKAFLLNILDLVSITYLIPAIILLLDKEKFYNILDEFGVDFFFVKDENIKYFLLSLLIFYVLKNVLHIKFNNDLFNYLYDLSSDISAKIVQDFMFIDYLSYQKKDKGKMIHMVMNVAEDFSCKYLHAIVILFCETTILIIILSFLFYFYPLLTLISLLILSVFSYLMYLKKKADFKLINSTYHIVKATTNSKLINILEAYLEIKSSQNEQHYIDTFNNENKKLNTVTSKLISTNVNYAKYLETTLILFLGIVIYFNFNSPNNNVLLIATLGALGFRLIPSLSKILTAVSNFKSHSYTVKVLNDIMTTTPKNGTTVIDFSTRIKIENLSFGYKKEENILENINFDIKKGEIIGISGISGIGKTTFLHIIMNLIKTAKGNIYIDDSLVNELHFFPFIKYVPQQPYLLSGSLLENLTMNKKEKEIDYKYLDYLCDRLDLTDTINGLKDNYNTTIQHNSLLFSGGQKQRISLVRALYGKPDLLILDEATNQQNKQLENQIFDFLKELSLKNNIAIIAVSHNETLTRYFNKTYILKNKKLIPVA